MNWVWMIEPLAKLYRIVLFDNCSWGLNSRLEKSSGIESPEKAEEWLRDWIKQLFESLTNEKIVPYKFLIAGHSMGCWLLAQFASMQPHRIEAFFMMSPCGTEPYDPKTYNPYKLKDHSDLRRECMDKDKVDKIIKGLDDKLHPLSELHKYPGFLTKGPTKSWTDACFRDDLYSEVIRAAAFEYFWHAISKPSVVDIMVTMPFKYDGYAIHPL